MAAVHPCIIFNPTAKGDKARKFRHELAHHAGEATFKLTAAAGDARRLAAEAVREGFETVVAAGGDGTLNEVLNGLGDTPDGFKRARLGVIPLGTVNVFARELRIPLQPAAAWRILSAGQETQVDVAWAEHQQNSKPERRYFAQLAGAGLDARAIELVEWSLKKRFGGMAYVIAGLRALREPPSQVVVSGGGQREEGQLVLVGNGQLYGGDFQLFPEADLRNGKLAVCVFSRANWWTLIRSALPLLLWRKLPARLVRRIQSDTVRIESPQRVPFELDGEWAGTLPVTLGVSPRCLRVVVP